MQAVIFLKDDEGVYTTRATQTVDGICCTRAVWNTAQPDQHGTAMVWEFSPDRHIVVSPLGTLLIDSGRYSVRAVDFATGFVYLDALEPQEMPLKGILFPLGKVVGTPAALDALSVAREATTDFLDRHMRGDWGEVCADDAKQNRRAVKDGTRILSTYRTRTGIAFWIITEADRSSTTILLPNDY